MGEVNYIGGLNEMRNIAHAKIHKELGCLPETKFASGIQYYYKKVRQSLKK